MKIAVVCPYDFSFPGGVQTQVVDFSEQLKKKGHEVIIFAPLSSKNIHDVEKVTFFNLGKPLIFNFLGSKSRFSINILKIFQAVKFIRNNKIEILHLHEPLVPSQLILSSLINMKKVGTFHAYGEQRHFWYYYFNFFLRIFVKKLDEKICVSELSEKYIKKYFDIDTKIIPNGININKFKKSKRIPGVLNNKNKKILFIGRFDEERKGFDVLLRSFEKLRINIHNLQLVIIGSGDFSLIKKNNENIDFSNVNFVGPISQNDLSSYYRNVDLVCLPSKSNESFGVIILESMASEKILVLSNIESYKNISIKNNYGYLYDSESPELLSNLIYKLLNNEINVRKNIENGLKNVENYSWEHLVSEIITVYKNLQR